MKQRSFLPLLGLFISSLLGLFVIMSIDRSVINPLIFLDLISLMIVGGVAFALYMGAFQPVGNRSSKLQVFKFRWVQEVLLLAGINGTIIGIVIMSVPNTLWPEGIPDEAIGSGMAVSLISFLYGLLGALGFYFIEKRLSVTLSQEQWEVPAIKPGFNVRSTLSLFFYVGIIFGIFVMSGIIMMGINPTDMIFYLPAAYLVIAVLLATVFIYGGKTVFQVWRIPLWRANEDEAGLLYQLKAVRGSKRIIALLGMAVAAITPIVVIRGLGGISVEAESYAPLLNTGRILFWCLSLILLLNLSEGQLVQQVYFQTGRIHYEDRFFLVKFILPSIILLWFPLWLVILFLFIV